MVAEKPRRGPPGVITSYSIHYTKLYDVLPSAQDHKAVYDGDKGPNTGGMGAYSPAPIVDRHMQRKIMNEVMVRASSCEVAEISLIAAAICETCPSNSDIVDSRNNFV